jgi:hypothetical protein
MATFDVSFLNPKLQKSSSQDYGFLTDQLTIKENSLASDGKLSPGDYDLLIAEGQKLYAHPGFTPEQRSNLAVKISTWQKSKKVSSLNDSQDITRLNNEVKDDGIKNSMLLASNPSAFMKATIASTKAKLNSLAESINRLQDAGDDASAHLLEYENTLNTYSDLMQASEDITNYQSAPSGKPTSAFAAYVTTNSKGEVTGINIEKAGSKTGYAETNGLYGGLPIYGNAKILNGKQTFKFGDQTFSAANILVPDPQNPGSFKNNKLVSESSQSAIGSGRTKATAGQYIDITPTTIRSQSVIPSGTYAMGSKGFIYQAKEDGSYKKLVNMTPQSLGIDPNDIPAIPKDYENNLIIPRVSETVDGSNPINIPAPMGMSTPAAPLQPTTTEQTTTTSGGRPNTPSPTVRAPSSSMGIADKVMGAAKSFLGGLFGK